MAIKVGYGSGVVLSSNAINDNIDVPIVDVNGAAFTPTAGQYLVFVYSGGRLSEQPCDRLRH